MCINTCIILFFYIYFVNTIHITKNNFCLVVSQHEYYRSICAARSGDLEFAKSLEMHRFKYPDNVMFHALKSQNWEFVKIIIDKKHNWRENTLLTIGMYGTLEIVNLGMPILLICLLMTLIDFFEVLNSHRTLNIVDTMQTLLNGAIRGGKIETMHHLVSSGIFSLILVSIIKLHKNFSNLVQKLLLQIQLNCALLIA